MNYKILILTLALCLCIVPFASAAHDYYPENKIVDTNPALSVPDPATYGYVVFNIIAGGAQDKTVWVINNANTKAAPFDCKFNPDRTERAGQNPDYTPIEVPGAGTTGILQYQSGSYTAYLQNGNGNQCERGDFIIGGATSSQATQVVFQGAAVSQLGKIDGPAPVITPEPKCHTHSIWIFGHYEYFQSHPHWRWIDGFWFTWECCKKHCDIGTNPN
jgi:hypothetical protein